VDQQKKRRTPTKAIRAYCIECSNGSQKEVRECVMPDCPLYDYRMGKNPNYKKGSRKGNPKGVEALRKWREDQKKGKANAKKN
jgi:hypothetical protein